MWEGQGRGEGVLISSVVMYPCIPTTLGRSTSGLHRTDKHRVDQARSAVRGGYYAPSPLPHAALRLVKTKKYKRPPSKGGSRAQETHNPPPPPAPAPRMLSDTVDPVRKTLHKRWRLEKDQIINTMNNPPPPTAWRQYTKDIAKDKRYSRDLVFLCSFLVEEGAALGRSGSVKKCFFLLS